MGREEVLTNMLIFVSFRSRPVSGECTGSYHQDLFVIDKYMNKQIIGRHVT